MATFQALAFLTAALLAAAPAAALDLTGTWQADDTFAGMPAVRCRYWNGARWERSVDGNLGRLYVSQIGQDLYVENGEPSDPVYSNKWTGWVVGHDSDPARGVAAATSCGVAGEAYRGAIFVKKARADSFGGTLVLELRGTSAGNVVQCKGRFTRSTGLDPGLSSACP
jgi:hypothetical protein